MSKDDKKQIKKTAVKCITVIMLCAMTVAMLSLLGLGSFSGVVYATEQKKEYNIVGNNLWDIDSQVNTYIDINSSYAYKAIFQGRRAFFLKATNALIRDARFNFGFKANTQYCIRYSSYYEENFGTYFSVAYTDGSYQLIRGTYEVQTWIDNKIITYANKTVAYIYVTYSYSSPSYFDFDTFLITEGTTETAYEPYYKYNTLDSSIVASSENSNDSIIHLIDYNRFGLDHDSMAVTFLSNAKTTKNGFKLYDFYFVLPKNLLQICFDYTIQSGLPYLTICVKPYSGDYVYSTPFPVYSSESYRYDFLVTQKTDGVTLSVYFNGFPFFSRDYLNSEFYTQNISSFGVYRNFDNAEPTSNKNALSRFYNSMSYDIYLDSFNFAYRGDVAIKYNSSTTEIYNNGYSQGYTKGIIDGENNATSSWNSLLPSILGSFASFFLILGQIEVFGTTLLTLCASFGALAIAFFVINKIRGA